MPTGAAAVDEWNDDQKAARLRRRLQRLRVYPLCLVEKASNMNWSRLTSSREKGLLSAISPDIRSGAFPPSSAPVSRSMKRAPSLRYIDETFGEPKLQPAGPKARARCNQLVSIADNYAYPHLVWGIYVERVSKPGQGSAPDEAKIAATVAESQNMPQSHFLKLSRATTRWLAGAELSPRRSLCCADVRLLPQGP